MGRVRTLSQGLFDRWERFSESRAALALLFVWAVAEATVWPIIADFLLVPMALVRRSRFRALMAAVLAGMSIGGIVTVLAAHLFPGVTLDLLRHLPLVGEAQIQRASALLDEHGAAGFLIQPVSGIPFKVCAVIAGGQGISPALVIPAFIVARAARMLANGAIAAVVGRLLRPRLRDWFVVVAALYVVLFAVGFAGILG